VGAACQREREGERTRGRERARLGWATGPRASAGPRNAGVRASTSAGASARAGRSAGPSQWKEGGSGPIGDFVFLFQKYE
jgi:hypothetical protein